MKKDNSYGKIKRDLIIRDTNLDKRFTTKVVIQKKHKKPKHKNNDYDN